MRPVFTWTVLFPLILLLFLPLVAGGNGLQAQPDIRGEICFVWYNVENLFHPANDSTGGDEEFTPQGPRHWTWSRYRDKLTALAKVIIASGRGEAPELVGLCEVENALVLEDLIAHPILGPYGYSYFHRDSPDHRGMDVACLIRGERIRAHHWECIEFTPPVRASRDMMHISLSWSQDTLDLFLVHLLSKYGGAGATADIRKQQCIQLLEAMDSVFSCRRSPKIMAAGDFNEAYPDYAMEPIRRARFGCDSLTLLLPGGPTGSYKYRGRWIAIDQVFVLQSFPDSIMVTALSLPPLLTEDQEYGGLKPRRCYEGFSYMGGISDHLPLLIDLAAR